MQQSSADSHDLVKQPQRVTFSVYTPNTLAHKISKKNPEAGRVRKFYASASEPTLQRNESSKPKRTRSASPPPRPVSFKFHQFVISKDSPRGSFQIFDNREPESSLLTKVAAKPPPNRPTRQSRDDGRPAAEPLVQEQPHAENSPYQLEALKALTALAEPQQPAVNLPPSASPAPAPAQQAHYFAAQAEQRKIEPEAKPRAGQSNARNVQNVQNVQHTPEMSQDEISQIVQLLQNQQFQTRSPQPQHAMRLPSMHSSPQANPQSLPSMPHSQLPGLADLHIQNDEFVLPPLSAMQALPDPLAHFRSSPNTFVLPKPILRTPM